MSPATSRPPISADEVGQKIDSLLRAMERGHAPRREVVEAVRFDFARLARTDGSIPSWRLAELDTAMKELVNRTRTSSVASLAVPAQRAVDSATRRSSDVAPHQERFDALRRRVDALHDAVEAGRRPTWKTLDDLQADLVAYRRADDGAEVRQMIDDLRAIRRRLVTAKSPRAASGLASSRAGRGFWGGPMKERRDRAPRRRGSSGSHGAAPTGEHSAERARLADESRRLRDRAERFAMAVPQGRTLPLRESERLFLHFKALRPDVDSETRALNDAAVRVLADAVIKVRRRAATA
ncbi:hypothetical protein ACQPX6_29740 [Actinomycetospora sp. CA-101289]|uniref:hypothetical protein n=1 Tax=Actinomycetospora sp. CA-101289 TaxID=3239893 RepID=UPI003D979779